MQITTSAERLAIIKEAMEHILSLEDGKMRFLQAVTELSRAFALAVPHAQALLRIRDEVGFFQAVLRKLLNDEIRIRSGRNLVQARSFSGMLEQTELLCRDSAC